MRLNMIAPCACLVRQPQKQTAGFHQVGVGPLLGDLPVGQDQYPIRARNIFKTMGCHQNGSVLGEVRLMENGRKQLYWRGIPVKVAPNWEKYAKKFYSGNYASANNANLTILCHKETLLHLTDTESAEVESYYDLSTRKNRIIVRYAMGAQIIYPQLVSTAYNH